MNDIPKKQNESRRLDLLWVQRALYTQSKTCFAWRTAISLFLALVGPVVTSFTDKAAVYVGVISIVYLLIDNLFLERVEAEKRSNAARVQELFDTELFGLPWNVFVSGKKPDPELIAEVLHIRPIADFEGLRDWYAVEVGRVPLPVARLICQRSNVWWDSALRGRYTAGVVACLGLAILSIIGLSVTMDLTSAEIVVGIVLPILPFLEWCIKQLNSNLKAKKQSHELKAHIEEAIEEALSGRVPNEAEARIFQDAICRHRSESPFIFDWLYNLLRSRQEQQMQFSVRSMVEQFETR